MNDLVLLIDTERPTPALGERPVLNPLRRDADVQIPACEVRLLALALMNAERLASDGAVSMGEECLRHGLSLVDSTVPRDVAWKAMLYSRWMSALNHYRERHGL